MTTCTGHKLYENIIWDFNGTLFNDGQLNCRLTNLLLAHCQMKPLSFKEYSQKLSFPINDFYKKIGLPYDGPEYNKLMEIWKENYVKVFLMCDFHEGMLEIIQIINKQGRRQYILSALHQELLNQVIEHHGLKHIFYEVVGTKSYEGSGKIQEGMDLMKNHKLDKKTSVMVGDTLHDYHVANHMEIPCLLLAHGHQDKMILNGHGRHVMENLEELKKFLSI